MTSKTPDSNHLLRTPRTSREAHPDETVITRERIELLRSKLLDLKATNPLLNYRHDPRRKAQIRIIDEVPDVLYERLIHGGRSMTLRAVPEPSDELVSQIQEESGRTPDEKETASSVGLNTNYELPERKVNGVHPDKHVDAFIQTLFFEERLNAKLEKIRKNTRSALQEMGVNTLYAAFGFLEWTEKADSKPMLSPLVLAPLQMERVLTRGKYSYSLAALDEEPATNHTLAHRLKADFQLVLPELEEDETPESYLHRIEELVSDKKGWEVRRYVTIGNFSFSRLAMYEDLNPRSWAEHGGLEKNEVILDLLSASIRDRNDSIEYVDSSDADDSRPSPLLVSDADSSQIGAIREALEGHSLVIKGPPGTGKSQTITNLIGAAMRHGKSVLFVAEKMAALEVVKKRLDDVGVGDFCLELHSTKSNKREVYESLAKRIEWKGERVSESDVSAKKRSLHEAKQGLNRYAQLLNSAFGDAGMKTHDVLWNDIAARRLFDEIRGLDRVVFHDPESFTDEDLTDTRTTLEKLESAFGMITEDGLDLQSHPWRFMTRDNLTPMDFPEIVRAVEQWRNELSEVEEVGRHSVGHSSADWSAFDYEQVYSSLLALDLDTEVDWRLFSRLAEIDSATELAAHLDLLDEAISYENALRSGTTATDWKRIAGIALGVEHPIGSGLPDTLTVGSLSEYSDNVGRKMARLRQMQEQVREVYSELGGEGEPTISDLKAIADAANLLKRTAREVLLFRDDALSDERNERVVDQFVGEVNELKLVRSQLEEQFDLRSIDDPSTLRDAIGELRDAGPFAFFRPSYRRAKKQARAAVRGEDLSNVEYAEALATIRDHLDSSGAELERHPAVALLGARYAGLSTDLDAVGAAVGWGRLVRRHLATPCEGFTHRVRESLLHREADWLVAVFSRLDDTALDALRAIQATSKTNHARQNPIASLLDEMESSRQAAKVFVELAWQLEVANAETVASVQALIHNAASHHRCVQQLESNEQAKCFLDAVPISTTEQRRLARQSLQLAAEIHALSLDLPSETFGFGLDATHAETTLHDLRAAAEDVINRLPRVARACHLASEAGWSTVDMPDSVSDTLGLLSTAIARRSDLPALAAYRLAWSRAERSLAAPLFSTEVSIPTSRLREAFDTAFFRSLARTLHSEHPELVEWSGRTQEQTRTKLRELDAEVMQLERIQLASQLGSTRPAPGVGRGRKADWTEMSLIQNEVTKKTRHVAIRDLLARAGTAVRQLKPCFMMSPASVAQYLEPGHETFDLVVIDEASQWSGPPKADSAFVSSGRHGHALFRFVADGAEIAERRV